MTRLYGLRLVSAMVASACLIVGCQGPTVKLSDGRQVSLGDLEREMSKAYDQLGKTSARITTREWAYQDLRLMTKGVAGEGQDPVLSTHSINAGAYRENEEQYLFDAESARVATHIKNLRNEAALAHVYGLPKKGADFFPAETVSLSQWKENGEVLSAYMIKGDHPTVTLDRVKTETTVKPLWEPMIYGLYNPVFFTVARMGGGAMEVVHEDNLELVKVTWGSLGATVTGWFRPDMGYRIHRIENRDVLAGNKLVSTIKASDYRVSNGVPYPFKYEVIQFDSPGHRQVSMQTRVETTRAEFDVQLQDKDFEVEVPQGASLVLLLPVVSRNESLRWLGFDGGFVTVSTACQSATTLPRATETVRADVNKLFEMAKAASPKPASGKECRPQ